MGLYFPNIEAEGLRQVATSHEDVPGMGQDFVRKVWKELLI